MKYNVNIYREMRLLFEDIEADTPEAAAKIARRKHLPEAVEIDDCEGRNFAALVDVPAWGNEPIRSTTVNFSAGRHLDTYPALLKVTKRLADYAENEASSLADHKDDPICEAEAVRAFAAVAAARKMIARENRPKQTMLDIRDLDHTWWEKVEAYRDGGQLHLPHASVERLGEIIPASGDASLISGFVEAKARTLKIGGEDVPVWTVPLEQLVTRPSRQTGRGDRGR